MLRSCCSFLAACVLVCASMTSRAQEPDLKAVIRKAIEAHGGEAKLAKYKAATAKFKGKLNVMALELDVVGEQSYLEPDRFRVSMSFQVNNMNIDTVQVFDGKSFWYSVLGKTSELKDEKLIQELRETLAVERASGMIGLLKKEYELSALGEAKVKDRDAIGIRAAKKGQRDLNLYFDKQTGLLIKNEYRTKPMGGEQEVTQEKFFLDHQDLMGLKSPKRVVVHHDGKLLTDLEITDAKIFESIDPSLFAKP